MRLTDLITKHKKKITAPMSPSPSGRGVGVRAKNCNNPHNANIQHALQTATSPAQQASPCGRAQIGSLPLWGRAGVGAANNPHSDDIQNALQTSPSPAQQDKNSPRIARKNIGAGAYKTRAAATLPKITLTLAACLLTACGSVPDTYHSLRPDISTTPTRQGTPTAIRYTELPNYYDNEYLVSYDEHGRINIDKSHHWTYPFSDNLRDVLRQAIAGATGNSRTYTYPLAENNRPEVLIDIQIRELIADPPHHTYRISAQWQTSRAGSDAAPTNHEYQQQLPLPQSDPDSIVATTAQAINQLAAAIARTL